MNSDPLDDLPFGVAEYFNQTTLHPMAGVALVLCGLLTVLLPRRYSLLPVLALVCFVPTSQRIVILGLDFTVLRIMVVFGTLRIMLRGESSGMRWRGPDTAMILWGIVLSAAYVLQWGTFSSAIWVSGKMFEGLGLYFIIRCLLRTWEDFRTFSLGLVSISILVSISFVNESMTGRNMFSIFGGVPEITTVRQGRLRCQGAFPHPILAGCFWAAMVPFMASLWWHGPRPNRLAAFMGVCSAGIIILTCASSTPVLSLMAGAAAGLWFIFRHHSRSLRYSVIAGLVALHLIMEAPVWHLISRIDMVGGSTGHHRFLLIDQAIRHFPEWALIGTKSTASWDSYGLLQDVTNEFILVGVQGGFLALLLFLLVIWLCFERVGGLWRGAGSNRNLAIVSWALGVSLFCHVTSFFAVSYFGQVTFGWYFSLAAIVSLSGSTAVNRSVHRSAHQIRPRAIGAPRGAARNLDSATSHQEQRADG